MFRQGVQAYRGENMLITGFIAGVIIGIIVGCCLAWHDYTKNGVPPVTIYKLNDRPYDFKEREK